MGSEMRKSVVAFVLLLFISSGLIAQKKSFTIEEAVIDSYFALQPENLTQLKWIPDTYEYSFIDNSSGKPILVKNRADSGKLIELTTLDDLKIKIATLGLTQVSRFPNLTWYKTNEFYFWQDKNLLSYNVDNKNLTIINKIPDDSGDFQLAPNNKYVAFTEKNNLFLSLDNDKTKQITFDTNENILNGQSVHRNEFGISGGIFWSPNSNYIAFYKMDQSMVTDYPILDVSTTPATVNMIKYPMVGQKSHEVKIAIYNVATGDAVFLKTGEPKDQYLTNISWDPREKFIYVAHLNRDQNHMRFIKYDITTGEQVKVLFEEKSDKYVEPMTPAFFIPTSDNEFLWLTRRDGWNHFYLYNTDGKLIKQVTSGNWEVIDFVGFDYKGEKVYFMSNIDEIPGRHLYSADLKSGDIKKLTDKPGTHRVRMSSNGKLFLDNHNSFDIPRTINIIDDKGEIQRVLLQAEDPIADYARGETKIFTIKGENNMDLYCRMITPPDFDENRKYPVIVYVYGGPHSQGVLNTWPFGRYDFWFMLMAQKGYIIFEIDNRGTANRGLEFEQATFRHLGTVEVDDQMRGVNYLKTLSYVDPNRFGVYGWSYGGFLAGSLMLRTNGTFKVAVGGGTVVDWKYYEIMYGERYMDTPESNPEGYAESSLLSYVENLSGKYLMVHGTSDPTVVWQNDLVFCKKAVTLNKPLDYFPYVDHKHGVRGTDTIHLYTKITNYFLDNL